MLSLQKHILLPMLAAAALGGVPALAQSTPAPAPAPAASANPPGTSGAPSLVTATVKQQGGWRASHLIGAAVYDDQNQKIGSVDDLIMSNAGGISVVIVSVGGFLGLGSKLVAVPYDHLQYDPAAKDAKVVMRGASKDSLTQMPSFTYENS